MRLLLDTHALLWWALDDSRLSRTAYAAIATYPWNIAIQVTLSLLLGILSCTAWALFGSALRPVLTSRRAVRAFNIVMAVLLLASLYPVFMDV